MNRSKLHTLGGLVVLLALAPVADAQRTDAADFTGTWRGTLDMHVIYDIPEGAVERLSKPIELEMRIFGRGAVELYFSFEENEWEFTEQRGFRITPISAGGDAVNAVIDARIGGNLNWANSFAFNMALQGEDEMLVAWSRLVTRNELFNNGLDSMGFAGTMVMTRED